MKLVTVAVVCAAALLASGCGRSSTSEADARTDLVAAATVPVPDGASASTARPDDAEAAASFPVSDPSALTERAPSPRAAKPAAVARDEESTPEDYIAPGAPSDEQIARELRQMERIQRSYESSGGGSASSGGKATLNPDGTASPPKGAPEIVRRIMSAGNAIAKFPYVYGGGHGSFIDTAYDCSGSVSYALAAVGLVKRPMVSGEFAKTGEEGPGKWVTIYANEGHMFMVVAGLRYDTSGRGGPLGSRWQTSSRSTAGLEVRHPPGL